MLKRVSFLILILFSVNTKASRLFNDSIATTTLYSWPLISNFNSDIGFSTSTFFRNFGAAQLQPSGLWFDVPHQTPRFQNGSYVSESASASFFAFPALQIRDLTQSSWVKNNISVLKNQPGMTTATATGTAQLNVASLVTATAQDGTILASSTVASSIRTFSAYVKRVNGSGQIFMTRDGGVNWVDITSQINNTTYTRVSITSTSTVTFSHIGFKINTSGDAIAVDLAIDENSVAPTSPFISRGDRSADALTLGGLQGFSTSSRYRLTADLMITPGLSAGGAGFTIGSAMTIGYNAFTLNQGKYGGLILGINASDPVITNKTATTTLNVLNNWGIEWGPANVRFITNNSRLGPDIKQTGYDWTGIRTIGISGAQQVKNLKIEKIVNYNNVVWFGDSITASNPGYVNTTESLMPELSFVFNNIGIGGNNLQDLINRQATDLNPLYAGLEANNTVVIFAGTNSLAAGVSGLTAASQLQTLINNIKATGNWRIVTITTLPRAGGFSGGVTQETFAQQAKIYNDAQRNGTITGISRVIDVTTIPTLQDPNNTLYFDSFKIHPIGQAVIDLGTFVGNSLKAEISMTATVGPVYRNSTNNTIQISGVNTQWTSGADASSTPQFKIVGGSGAQITSQTITSTTSATVTISAGDQNGVLQIVDPSSGAFIEIEVIEPLPSPVATPTVRTSTVTGYGSSVVSIPQNTIVENPVDVVKPMSPTFTKNLSIGIVHSEVKLLQQYLNKKGFTVAKTGPGSIGNETTRFGAATRAALIQYQKAMNIKPAQGYFGPVTRASVK